jgi:uncharacterized protein (UPF0332 family)
MKEATQQLLDKAARAAHAAETLLQAGDVEFATGRVYYVMFYVAEALLNEKGLHFRRHSSRVHAAFGAVYQERLPRCKISPLAARRPRLAPPG